MTRNVDLATVEGFGEEWDSFDQSELSPEEHESIFSRYFSVFPLHQLAEAEGFDLGSGSGRWAALVAPKVKKLHCIDPAEKALQVSRRRLTGQPNIEFHLATVDEIPLPDASQDFGYSLGVLHHVPNTEAALADCTRKLKPGAPFLLYLYYSFDNRPWWFRTIWKASDVVRRAVSSLPFRIRKWVCSAIAVLVYLPLALIAAGLEKLGINVESFPLSAYRQTSFYTMRTDALDRFGTRLEQRFSRQEIREMMYRCGLNNVTFSDKVPYWVACGWRQAN